MGHVDEDDGAVVEHDDVAPSFVCVYGEHHGVALEGPGLCTGMGEVLLEFRHVDGPREVARVDGDGLRCRRRGA